MSNANFADASRRTSDAPIQPSVNEALQVGAPAKINLCLRVGPLAAEGACQGFHPLLSWMVTVGLFDTLIFTPRKEVASASGKIPPDNDLLALNCEMAADMPPPACDQSNLIVRAAAALLTALNPRAQGTKPSGEAPSGASTREEDASDQSAGAGRLMPVAVCLQKHIPMGAGLGGGSSDAAAALEALNRLWCIGFDTQRLAEIALRLGSDVPFFLSGPSSICRGRGEIIRPIPAPKLARWAALFLLPWGMPTPAVYQRYDQMHLGANFDRQCAAAVEPDFQAWAALPATQFMRFLVNDLEAPAFSLSPRLGLLRREIEQRLGRAVRMSGSGSSLFTLFDSAEEAQIACQRVLATPLRRMQGLAAKQELRALALEVCPQLQR